MGTLAIGGLYLVTPDASSDGSMLELLFDVATGTQVRARAVVCYVNADKGMGVKFVHMHSDDRPHLNQFLKTQLEAGNIQKESPDTPGPAENEREKWAVMECEAKQSKALNANSSRDRNKPSGGMVHIPREISRSSEVAAPAIALLNDSPGLKMPSELSSEQSGSAEELQKYLILTNNSNHYQLLGVTADSSQKDIKYSFYCLARKFHPDRHMIRPDWVGPLQHLMAALPKAYVVLRDDHKRNNYGKQLALASIRSEAEESIDDSAKLAVNCQRDANIPGAIFWLRKCIILAPKAAKHRMSLGVILATMPLHRREAVEQLNKAVELDAWNADAYLQLGEVYEVMLLLWRSKVLYTKVLDLYPEHAMARQRLEKVSGGKKKPMSRLISSWFKK